MDIALFDQAVIEASPEERRARAAEFMALS